MQLCEYVFPIGLPLYVPKNGFFGGFEGEDVKILCYDPQKALPYVNTRLLVYFRLDTLITGMTVPCFWSTI